MAVTYIKRITGATNSLVQLDTSDSIATATAAGYLTAQNANITALNDGQWTWETNDLIVLSASDGVALATVNAAFTRLVLFAFSTTVIGAPVVVGDFAVFASTSGNIEDLGYLPSDASKTNVVMANSATVANRMAVFTDTAGTVDDTTALATHAGNIAAGLSGTAGTVSSFPGGATSGALVLAAVTNGSGNFSTTISNSSTIGQSQVISIPDSGASTANFLLSSVAAGQSVSGSTTSATPGTIRAFKGLMTGTNATMTSGNLVGVRGEVDYVGASGGFLYGIQGKLIPTGTISGSSWNAGVFGQLDISAATVNAGQMAPIWGDYGTSSGTLTDQTGLYGIAMTNTTAVVTQGQIYLYGGSQNLLLLNTNLGLSGVTYFINSGTTSGSWGNATPPTPSKVLRISVDGTQYYIPLVAQNT
jgi:hypothetical protein